MRDQSAYAATTSCIDTGSVTMMIINGHDAFRRFTRSGRGQGSRSGRRQTRRARDPAACVAFYFSLYVLDDTQMATFAAFGCISLGALSEVTGEPWERTRTYGIALLAGIGLVSLGTVLAVNTWAAVAGMLVVGFVIAYAGVGGPRVVGVANGLQLLYILPSFPPYQPDALGSRLIGLVLAVGLLMIADRVLWPPPVPTPFRHRLAAAIHAVRDRLVALRESDGDGRAPAESDVQGAIARPLSSIPPSKDRPVRADETEQPCRRRPSSAAWRPEWPRWLS